MLAPTSVTLIGVEVCSAMYCSALYRPMPSSPSSANRRHWPHSALPGRSTPQASDSSSAKASSQRRKLSVNGETSVCTMRPATALPAHISGAITSRAVVAGVSFCVMPQL